jgi:hypothetical protein
MVCLLFLSKRVTYVIIVTDATYHVKILPGGGSEWLDPFNARSY